MNGTSLSALLPPLSILLLGYGRVAKAFLPLLASRSEWLGSEFGVHPVISGVGSRSQGFYIYSDGIDVAHLTREGTSPQAPGAQCTRVDNAEAFVYAGKAVGASVLVELTTLDPQNGQPALDHIRMALQASMDVITANKGPVAFAQPELQGLARRYGVQFRFESTVLDGLPLLNLAEATLPAVGIRSFRALLNTTSNVVLSMLEQGYSQEDAISKARQLGVAEADPWYDLDGWDAVMKTTILANTLLEGHFLPHMVEREGIRALRPQEISSAAASGSPIRLVSQANRNHGVLIAEVRPHRIKLDDILHVGTGMTGVISLDTEALGPITLVEHEPSVRQTAYGVFSDLVTILRRRSAHL